MKNAKQLIETYNKLCNLGISPTDIYIWIHGIDTTFMIPERLMNDTLDKQMMEIVSHLLHENFGDDMPSFVEAVANDFEYDETIPLVNITPMSDEDLDYGAFELAKDVLNIYMNDKATTTDHKSLTTRLVSTPTIMNVNNVGAEKYVHSNA